MNVSERGKLKSAGATRLADRAYSYIKSLLFSGKLAPGSRVLVDEIVEAVEASRQPVMEALKRLAGEGYVEVIPQVGCRVIAPKPGEIQDFFRLFAGAQALAAEFAAVRGTAGECSDLLALHDDIAALCRSPFDADVKRLYRAKNRAFHQIIHRMAHSPIIATESGSLWDRSDFYIATAKPTPSAFAKRILAGHAEHETIVQAIADRDPQRARFAMELHILAFGASSHRSGLDPAAHVAAGDLVASVC